MIQLTINMEGENNKAIIETLQGIIKSIQAGSDGDFEDNVSWWLENTGGDSNGN